jgi:hypothetical protein
MPCAATKLLPCRGSLRRSLRRPRAQCLPTANSMRWTANRGCPDQAARHRNCTSTKAFREIVAKERVPRHHLSDRLSHSGRSELDEWFANRKGNAMTAPISAISMAVSNAASIEAGQFGARTRTWL